MPKVSVIIPTHNRAHLLPRALDSVLSQSYKDMEIIIVDDGSSDETPAVIARYTDPRIRTIRYETPQGIPTVRNRGMQEARGEYIAWQDDDDEWLPGKLEKQVAKMETLSEEYGVVYSAYWRMRKDGTRAFFPPRWVQPQEGDLYKVFLKKNFLCLQSMLMRKKVFETVGGLDKRFPVLQEYDWFPKIAERFQFAYIPEPLTLLHHTPKSNSQNNTLNAFARELFIQDRYPDLLRFKFLGYHYGLIGDLYMGDKKPWRAATFLWKSVRHEPFRARHWVKALCASCGINYLKLKIYLPTGKRRFKI
ncbi:MAG: glycosyltransferase family A protein [Patescibacteria group bacterium]